MQPKLAITCGDPAGIGPEIIAAWLRASAGAIGEVAVIGPSSWLRMLPTEVEKIPVGLDAFSAVLGQPTSEGALVAYAAMELAARGCREGRFAGVVTGPVSKAELAKIGYAFPGQTEFFADRWGGDPVMAFNGGRLRVVLATWHVPFCEVPQRLGPQMLHRTVAAAAELARSEGVAQPRIAVCGLNPHAGEDGLLGEEERDFLNPALAKLRGEFPGLVPSCLPGDTVFARQLRGEFDVVVALYHDQGLAPLKTVDFDAAVNITLGLPYVRTSPDHGTAFGIAGRGVASATSFTNAVATARRLIVWRARGDAK
ncbi:MAG: 4-hydroxythreonine-4-phosphate dehydrogenase PdxA [Opitutaceae bacterium]|nr:4-hydroxythreonine-4-phosphate dehydrogenase PdxA [Opitutaceae bacterium]